MKRESFEEKFWIWAGVVVVGLYLLTRDIFVDLGFSIAHLLVFLILFAICLSNARAVDRKNGKAPKITEEQRKEVAEKRKKEAEKKRKEEEFRRKYPEFDQWQDNQGL